MVSHPKNSNSPFEPADWALNEFLAKNDTNLKLSWFKKGPIYVILALEKTRSATISDIAVQ